MAPLTIALALTAASAATTAVGTLMGGAAAADAGARAKSAYEYRAKQEEQAAQENRAVAQRTALEKRHQGELLGSTLQARAAASVGVADDPTVLGLAGNIAGRSEYDALFEMYRGENRARGLEDQAVASRMSGDAALAEGKAKQTASYFSAAGTVLGGASSMYRTYNGLPSERSYG